MTPRANVVVRVAAQADALEIAELLLPLEPGVPSVLPSGRGGRGRRSDHLLGLDAAADHVRTRVDDPATTLLVATDSDTAGHPVVGVVLARFEDAGLLAPTRVLAVGRLAVAPRLRRRGVGRELLTACIEMAEADGVQYLQSVSNPAARDANRYLARVGFAAIATRRMASVPTVRRALGLAPLGLVTGQHARLARRPRIGAGQGDLARRLAR